MTDRTGHSNNKCSYCANKCDKDEIYCSHCLHERELFKAWKKGYEEHKKERLLKE